MRGGKGRGGGAVVARGEGGVVGVSDAVLRWGTDGLVGMYGLEMVERVGEGEGKMEGTKEGGREGAKERRNDGRRERRNEGAKEGRNEGTTEGLKQPA